MKNETIAKCIGISMSHFLNTPYKNQSVSDLYAPNGFESKASKICHYCTIDTLKAILNRGCLRFSDVRFLNDSTEFIEILNWIEMVVTKDSYNVDFQKMILESEEMKELREYQQSYVGVSNVTHQYEIKAYGTYTCSFSVDTDALSMWNYYAQSGEGVNITFDHSGNMFDGCNIRGYDVLSEKANGSSARFHELSQTIKDAEKRLGEIAVLRTHIINYAKTRDVYVAYRKSGYSKKFLEEHREESKGYGRFYI